MGQHLESRHKNQQQNIQGLKQQQEKFSLEIYQFLKGGDGGSYELTKCTHPAA